MKPTLADRALKDIDKYEKVEHDYQKAQVIHSLIHKISEVYSSKGKQGRKYLNELEVNLANDLWRQLYYMVEDATTDLRLDYGFEGSENPFEELFKLAGIDLNRNDDF